VTFSFTPPAASSRISSVDGSPRVLVTGTFTYTLSPQAAIWRACRRMPAVSSSNTSNEIGLSRIAASTSRANAT
jgi:hypothetical protein